MSTLSQHRILSVVQPISTESKPQSAAILRMIHADRPLIMGILNMTPDSFSDGGHFYLSERLNIEKAVDKAANLLAEGADILDVGGESTRPGAMVVGVEEELARVIPVIEALRQRFDVPLSIDTSAPMVMTAAVDAGASLINDVRALTRPGALAAASQAVQTHGVAVCLMHMRGEPGTMTALSDYQDLLPDVVHELGGRIAEAVDSGIPRSNLLLDPGFGFAKTTSQNLLLLKNLGMLKSLGLPILAGLSRKRMIGDVTERAVPMRQVGSVVLAVMAIERGAHIVRVHDVAATRDGVRLLMAVQAGRLL